MAVHRTQADLLRAVGKLGPYSPPPAADTESAGGGLDRKAVRTWAADNGYTLSARGPVPAEVLAAYTAAQIKE